MSELGDRVVLITGAGQGLGRVLAMAFAGRGAQVALNDFTPIHLDEVETEIEAVGGRAKSYVADISNKLALQTMISEVLTDFGRIDILVNNAGVAPKKGILEMDEWDWRRTIEVNLTGVFLTTQVVGRVMRELGGGVILNMGVEPEYASALEMHAAYLAAKQGVIGLTKAAEAELAADKIQARLLEHGSTLEETAEKALRTCAELLVGEPKRE